MKFYRNFGRIYFICTLSIVTLIVLGLLFIKYNRFQIKYINEAEHTYKLINAVNEFEKLLLDAETGQRGYLLTREESFKRPLQEALPKIDLALVNVESFIVDTQAIQKAYLFQLKKLTALREKWLLANMAMKEDDPDITEKLTMGKVVMDKCREYMNDIKTTAHSSLKDNLADKERSQRLNFIFFTITFVFACIICIAALAIFIRELGKRITVEQELMANINELKNSNNELEEITYAASHDLQEPIRKIRILTTLLSKRLDAKINEEDRDILNRLTNTTEKMHDLMHDLVLYFNLLARDQHTSIIDLNMALKEAYDAVLYDKNVFLKIVNKIPTINGYRQQVQTMLTHILENSVKFKHTERDLMITVHYKLKKELEKKYFWQNRPGRYYHQVTITDNGIGFNNEYNEKVFGLFQRLTIDGFTGKGIGLAIARRVMMNHKGYIKSRAEEGTGASFILYFPAPAMG